MKQKAALAGALIHEPKLLILDEPLTGLDAAVARQVKDLLLERARAGATVILTTHILEVAERLADRIGIIQSGRLLAEGTLAELRIKSGRKNSTLGKRLPASRDQATRGRMSAASVSLMLRHELRLGWRAASTKVPGKLLAGCVIFLLVLMHLIALPFPFVLPTCRMCRVSTCSQA